MRDIRQVAVLGAGTMGSRIAAHLANASISCYLLDIVAGDLEVSENGKRLALSDMRSRNRIALAGLDAALNTRPPAFFVPEAARLITLGNFDDNLQWVKECDWIIEAVAEDIEIKRALLRKVEPLRAPHATVSSNTSGISIASIVEGFSNDFRRHWLGTHFFNPPRYMKLLELIPTHETIPEVVETISRFGDVVLGKGIVIAKDTPNFIANRIGTFFTLSVLHIMQRDGYTIEEIDALTGPVMGLPKSATLRMLDLVGLDIKARVVRNLAEALPHDDRPELFCLPEFVAGMLNRRLLGEKTGRGFYRKVKGPNAGESEILTLDLKSFEYRKWGKPNLPALEKVRGIDDPRQRVVMLIKSRDRAGFFYQKLLSDTFHYAASRIPEISDDIISIDNAMKWGFNWECGVFEIWDAVGVGEFLSRWREELREIPPLVEKLLAGGRKFFYIQSNGTTCYFDVSAKDYRPVLHRPEVLELPSLEARKKQIKGNANARLLDLGEGVLCLEFLSQMNLLAPDSVEMIHAGEKLLNEDFDALVISSHAANFSLGADLSLLLACIQGRRWNEIDEAVRLRQNALRTIKYAPKPVVAAPFGLTRGCGAELCLHTAQVRAAAETYLGFVEASVGLIPSAGGTKELLVRAMSAITEDHGHDCFPLLKEIFLSTIKAEVSTSAQGARKLHYLSRQDSISMNRNRLLADAKQVALNLVKLGSWPMRKQEDIPVLGQAAFAKLKLVLHLLRRGERITDYDVVVGTHLARILTGGGEFTSPQKISEQYLLDLEREAFISLCGEKWTAERIQHMLKKEKPFRY